MTRTQLLAVLEPMGWGHVKPCRWCTHGSLWAPHWCEVGKVRPLAEPRSTVTAALDMMAAEYMVPEYSVKRVHVFLRDDHRDPPRPPYSTTAIFQQYLHQMQANLSSQAHANYQRVLMQSVMSQQPPQSPPP